MRVAPRDTLRQESLQAMNFLNEAVMAYPEAVSFAPGRPMEQWFGVGESLAQVRRFARAQAATNGLSETEALDALGQYGRTNGVIGDLIARYLSRDEGIEAKPEDIMVVSGCQEAMAILVMGLFEPDRDTLLISDPAYVGIAGVARVLGVDMTPVAAGDFGLTAAAVRTAVHEARRRGKRPRALYDVPDFNNPLGTSMPLEQRHQLLRVAEDEDLLIFEDNPYGQFAYDGEPAPTLKSLDRNGRVIYMGTFSKTLFPGLRLGYIVADQRTEDDDAPLTDTLSKVKSFVSVNTSQVLQALVGGVLIERDCSLKALLQPKVAFYRDNRDAMLNSLARFTAAAGPAVSGQVRWNRPAGGFFLALDLPFAFGAAETHACASEFGVICCPMSLFSLGGGRARQIRLSFSYVTPDEIETGVSRLVDYIKARVAAA